MAKQKLKQTQRSARERLLDGALTMIRSKGYAATSVGGLCELAGVTKGAFFHHFRSKEDLAVAAAAHWSQVTGALFAAAPYHQVKDPLARVLSYVQFRKELLQGSLQDITCLAGTMVQETYLEHPKIQEACRASIFGHAATLEADIDQAKRAHAPGADWTARSLALHIQGTLQGAFILAKASGDINDATEGVVHLERYLRFLFSVTDGTPPT